MAKNDVIGAIATPAGRGGVGVVRLSGTDLTALAVALTGRPLVPRHAALRPFLDARGEAIDEGLALYFAAPASYTGEDVLELQGHGGPAVMQLLLGRCLELGVRLAEPGEFTRRAFLNGRLDLAQAEAVADLIDAATAQAAQSALRSLRGEFSVQVEALVAALVDLRVLLEGSLDFPDEGIDFLAEARATERMRALAAALAALRARAGQGALLRDGLEVVLVGRPNVGKSSLLNRLAGFEAAIVTDVPGTTRDTVAQQIAINGVPLHVVDTAGLRETADAIERIGIARTHQAIGRAGLAVLLLDATVGMTPADAAIRAALPEGLAVLAVANKADLAPDALPDGADLAVSARTGAGFDALRMRIAELAGLRTAGEEPFMARARHLQALDSAARHLDQALGAAGVELAAEELRLAQRALAAVTGAFSAEDLLGEIFSRFCIGK